MHRARRRFGQHFLSDPRILSRIADALHPEAGQLVLEIGPGQGALTVQLVKRGVQLTAIEVDRDLVPGLRERFPSVNIVEGDALELDWHEVMRLETSRPQPLETFLLTGNIPYNITSPLLDKALTPPRPARIVFLVQKEVADRITAKAGSSDYGARKSCSGCRPAPSNQRPGSTRPWCGSRRSTSRWSATTRARDSGAS
jgi:16S rRNA (adenine1518-N6/adenine1519-N6)-dimethyltransferase